MSDLHSIHSIERRRRLRIVAIAVPALLLLAVMLWIIGTSVGAKYLVYLGARPHLLFLFIIPLLLTSGFSLILRYLQTGFLTKINPAALHASELRDQKTGREQASVAETFQKYEEELAALRNEVQSTREALGDLSDETRAKLVGEIRATLQSEAASAVLAELRSRVAAEYQQTSQDRELAARLDDSRFRLQRELDALGRRGNLNLTLGAITTVVGISLLGVSVFAETTVAKDMWTLASHFAPRLTLVLLIELFAFFFLSLYKSSLSEIKYLQNEITNIESRQLALRVALSSNEPTLLADVVGKLASTERNHILSKDQTTIELEKVRIDRDSQNSLAKAITEIIQKKV